MLRSICITIILTIAMLLSAISQDVLVKDKNIILEFENIRLKDIEFVDSNKIEIEHAKKADVIISKEKGKVIIKSDVMTKIDLLLPMDRLYTLNKDGNKIEFNENKVSIYEGKNKIVEFRDGGLFVTDNDETVEISSEGIIVNDKDEYVEISSRGIIVDTPDDNQNLTGFWGQLLGGAINFITKISIGWIGNNPEFIVKHIVNDKDNNLYVGFDIGDDDMITQEFHNTFNPVKGCKLNVHNRNGKVEIKKWEKDYIDITAIMETRKSEKEFEKIKIEVLDNDGCTIKTTELERNPKVAVHYDISVPKGVIVTDIKSSNGKILIIGCEGEMVLDTSNGKIEVFDSKGSFKANSSNGRIEFVNLEGRAKANTSNGAIRVVRTPGLEKCVTSNGKITIEIDRKIKNDIDLSTSNGSIAVTLDPTLDLNIDASTSNSHIDLNEIEITTTEFSKNSLAGRINKGGKKLTASTSNGSIKFYKLEK